MMSTLSSTLSEAIAHLVREGFTEHFGVRDNHLFGFESGTRFEANEVIIRGFDRFEGVSDPGDMSIVYAIETFSGLRGTLADAFGVYSNPLVSAFVSHVAVKSRESGTR